MKKIPLLVIFHLLFFLTISSTTVLARAGGGMGSSSSSGSNSTSNGNYDNYNYYGNRGYNNYGRSRFPLLDAALIGFVGFSFFRFFKKNRQENFVLPETYDELSPELNAKFEPFFYQVEDAWTKNDLDTLENLMTPRYFAKQKRIIMGYIREHKIDHLDGLVVVEVEQVVKPPSGKIQVIVTAQARDYFQYDNKSEQYNQQIQEDTNIERFSEIWTLSWKDGNKLQLVDIKIIS